MSAAVVVSGSSISSFALSTIVPIINDRVITTVFPLIISFNLPPLLRNLVRGYALDRETDSRVECLTIEISRKAAREHFSHFVVKIYRPYASLAFTALTVLSFYLQSRAELSRKFQRIFYIAISRIFIF